MYITKSQITLIKWALGIVVTIIVLLSLISFLDKTTQNNKEKARIKNEQLKEEENNKVLKKISDDITNETKLSIERTKLSTEGAEYKKKFFYFNRLYQDRVIRSASESQDIFGAMIKGFEKDCKSYFSVPQCNVTKDELSSLILTEDLNKLPSETDYITKSTKIIENAYKNNSGFF